MLSSSSAANKRSRSPALNASNESRAHASTRSKSGDSRRNLAKTRVSSALAACLPARKRRASWKNEAPSALGTRALASSLSSLRRRLCFGFAPSEAGTHAPGATGGQTWSSVGGGQGSLLGQGCGAVQL